MCAAVVSTLLVTQASAAGLGKLSVLSGIGQPLRAEIELTAVTADEARSLQPKLASMEAFRQANIEFNPTLQSLRFAVEERAGRQLIRITSSQPISEPFVDVLLEINSANGRLVREYTFLLDPPELRSLQPAQVPQVVQAAPVAAPSAVVAANLPAPGEAAPATVPAKQATVLKPRIEKPVTAVAGSSATKVAGVRSADKTYQVQPGDSLWKIANRAQPQGISLDQMLVALYRANPDAFVDNNMNRLRSGQILSLPDANAGAAVSAPDARAIVIAQAADFNDYRNKLAGQVATGTAQKAGANRQSASGTLTAKVEERPTAANEALDKLRLSKADAGNAALKTAAAQEERIAREKAAAESASRVKDLEKNVSDLQKLLDLKSKDLADRQAAATTTAVNPPVAVTVPLAAPVTAPKPVPAAAKPVATAVKPKLAEAPPQVEESLFDELIGNPLVQGGAALLVVLLAALGFSRSRGRKQEKNFDNTAMPDNGLKANSLFGATGGQSVDTSNSVFNSSFAPSANVLDSNEVDPVAEADVYIAYGRDAQAEEILKEALRTQPERHAVRLKLLEVYAARKDVRAFESVATELYSMSKGEGDDWPQAATMGLALDPTNPLYAGGKTTDTIMRDSVLAPALDDTADLDSFLEEVSAAHPFADTITPQLGKAADLMKAEAAMDLTVPMVAAALAPHPEPVAEAPVATIDDGLDFDLDGLNFDTIDRTPAERIEPAPVPVAAEPLPAGEVPLSALDFDFLLSESAPSPTLAMTPSETPVTSEKLNLAPVMPPDIPQFDLSGITLDLPEPDPKFELEPDLTPPRNTPGSAGREDFGALDLGDVATEDDFATNDAGISNNAEMATKLDLAVAYQEIGDHDGARELLDEVLKGGSAEQSDRAKSILATLE